MTLPYENLEQLLAEHVVAKECGLLADRASLPERRRLDPETVPARAEESRWPARGWLVGAAAALMLAVGLLLLWALLGGQPEVEVVEDAPKNEPTVAEFLNGRGRLQPMGEGTRYTLVDAARGHVRLEQGELFVELPAGEDLRADIETAAGTATALGTSFYASYEEAPPQARSPFLTVAVVGGFVEVHNPHGRALAGAGEVVLADGGAAPIRQAAATAAPPAQAPEQEWWRFGNVTGILQRTEVQAELKLTEEQKTKLHRSGEDGREMGRFFRELYSVAPEERAKKTAEFRAAREQKIAQVLEASQQRRLGQLALQQQGFAALGIAELAERLQLSEEQRRQVESASKELNQARQSALARWGGPDFAKRMDELRQQEAENLKSLLNEAQRVQWQALTGAAFKLERQGSDWRDWYDFGSGGWGPPPNWMEGRERWRPPDKGRGPWGPGGWPERRERPPNP